MKQFELMYTVELCLIKQPAFIRWCEVLRTPFSQVAWGTSGGLVGRKLDLLNIPQFFNL